LNSRKHFPAIDVRHFMSSHWQREPLLVRGAFPAFEDPLSPREVLRLAGREDASARVVQRRAGAWSVEHGPFAPARFKQLPRRDWTVLVQDTNLFSPAAQRLLARFDFIPHARIDDVMVSYAAPGGGWARMWTATMSSFCRGVGVGAGASRDRRTCASCPACP
jgi:50S ribosomal protein L16 3-hydroxylase